MNPHAELVVPAGPFDGYIFDCDGTLAETMPLHYKAWTRAFEELKTPFVFDEDYFYSLGGTPTVRIVQIFNEKYGTSYDPQTVSDHKEHIFTEIMHDLTPIDEVIALARQYKAEGKPVSVASGGTRPVVLKTLEAIGLKDFFPIVVTAEDVVHGKPFPDMFLLAAERMGTTPDKTLVFEDALTGINAAKAAKMQYAVVPHPSVRGNARPPKPIS
ncbi:haloacid dehalogenase superfamily, subfamily IA, variant 3 with third motif having DD or ED [Verrucomicrobium sp. GAS474]|uniref:HAD family hydrolase n=1 Tax=Verrucomicrobium sp. GAS474 TaxID=1882831 RepID=UPI00087CA8D4|nr:HAD family phosphatase [Verrucomicrobium sp. GAS474]SDU16759.1 haloacid dehalogenase superfamily, subfamily IA, variant 3 with third motif having DD or ED [Verrucomicrobium sp. GAS474]